MINIKLLKPNWDPELKIQNLPLKYLLNQNIKALILDVDDTLLSRKEVILNESVKEWVIEAKKYLKIHLLSNNIYKKRISNIAKELNLSFTFAAGKPRKRNVLSALDYLQCDNKNIAMIGDRIFTDILAGNRIGLYTVLVKPINSDDNYKQNINIQNLELVIAKFMGAYK